MRLANIILALALSFLAAVVLQYGFNNLVLDYISFRPLSYFDSFVIVKLLGFVAYFGYKPKYVSLDDEDEEYLQNRCYEIIAKGIGYLFFWAFFAILVWLK